MFRQCPPALRCEYAKRSVRYAVNHLIERQAVMAAPELIEVAMQHGVGSVQLADVKAEIERRTGEGYLIREAPLYRPASEATNAADMTRDQWVAELIGKGMDRQAARARVDRAIDQCGLRQVETRYTTQTALEREQGIHRIEREGRGAVAPILPAAIVHERLAETTLNTGQREAAELMATSTNRVIGVQGFAGTGKSHMLDTAKGMIEDEGYIVRALAPYRTCLDPPSSGRHELISLKSSTCCYASPSCADFDPDQPNGSPRLIAIKWLGSRRVAGGRFPARPAQRAVIPPSASVRAPPA